MSTTIVSPLDDAIHAVWIKDHTVQRYVGKAGVSSTIDLPDESESEAPLGKRSGKQMWMTLGDTSEIDLNTFGKYGVDVDITCDIWHRFESRPLMTQKGVKGAFGAFKLAIVQPGAIQVEGHVIRHVRFELQNTLPEFSQAIMHAICRLRALAVQA